MKKPEVTRTESETTIAFYTLNDLAKKTVREELENTFTKKAPGDVRDMAQDIMYTCIKELMVNASKSNIKRTFMIEASIDENDRGRYESARKNVRKLMREHAMVYLQSKLEKHGFRVEVSLSDTGEGIVMTVKNSVPLLAEEEKDIRKLLKEAMSQDTSDLTLFFHDHTDQYEGAGMGLYLVVQLLKEMKINPAYFRIGVVNNHTIARLEIPYSSSYHSIRDKTAGMVH